MTLIGAAYLLKKTHPDCKVVQGLKATGIEDVMDMSITTPYFANSWLKHQANMHHDGIRYAPAESLYDSQEGEQEWVTYRQENNIKVGHCPPSGPMSYAKQKDRFVFDRFENRWNTPLELLKTLDCARAYREKEMFGDFAAFLANIDVAKNKMSNQDIFEISELILKMVRDTTGHFGFKPHVAASADLAFGSICLRTTVIFSFA